MLASGAGQALNAPANTPRVRRVHGHLSHPPFTPISPSHAKSPCSLAWNPAPSPSPLPLARPLSPRRPAQIRLQMSTSQPFLCPKPKIRGMEASLLPSAPRRASLRRVLRLRGPVSSPSLLQRPRTDPRRRGARNHSRRRAAAPLLPPGHALPSILHKKLAFCFVSRCHF